MISEFEKYLQYELNRSKHTVRAYICDVRAFAGWLTGGKPDAFRASDVTTSDIRGWLAQEAPGLSSRSLRRKTQSIRAFFHWMRTRGYTDSNPAADIQPAKLPKHLPETLKESEIEEIIANHPNEFRLQRARFILLMLYSTGIRQEELRTLTDADIDFSLREAKILGKRNKQRIVPLPDSLLHEIKEWQSARAREYPTLEALAATERPLIAGPHGFLSPHTLYNIVHEALSATSATRKSPHTLRHTFATAMLNNGASLDSVKEFLGHQSLATTQIYTHLSFAEMRRAYSAAHPRMKEKNDSETKKSNLD